MLRRALLDVGERQHREHRADELPRKEPARQQQIQRRGTQPRGEARARGQERQAEGAHQPLPALQPRAEYPRCQRPQHRRRAQGALRRAVELRRKPQHVAHKVRKAHRRRAADEKARPCGQQQEPQQPRLLPPQKTQALPQIPPQPGEQTPSPARPRCGQAYEALQPRRQQETQPRRQQHRPQAQPGVGEAAQEGSDQPRQGLDLVHHRVAAQQPLPREQLRQAGLHHGRLESPQHRESKEHRPCREHAARGPEKGRRQQHRKARGRVHPRHQPAPITAVRQRPAQGREQHGRRHRQRQHPRKHARRARQLQHVHRQRKPQRIVPGQRKGLAQRQQREIPREQPLFHSLPPYIHS